MRQEIRTRLERSHAQQVQKSLLRFMTCGSVDDGKSTLLGRLLYDCNALYDDQLESLRCTNGQITTLPIDFSVLLDGLAAEREQGITIDVAYRYFSTASRRFILADTPGHAQFTRNMATAASVTDLAIILIDARKGLLEQTRRHTTIASFLGIQNFILAVNKMDLVNYDHGIFERTSRSFKVFSEGLGIQNFSAIPVVATDGDNVTTRSERMPWFKGATLIDLLDNVEVPSQGCNKHFRFPVQYVIKSGDFRGFCGKVAAGAAAVGDPVREARSGKLTVISRITVAGCPTGQVTSGQSATISLADDIELARGNILTQLDTPPHATDQLCAMIIWFHEKALLPGRSYLLRTQIDQVAVTVTSLKSRVNIDSGREEAASELRQNEIGMCNLRMQQPICFDEYKKNRETGSFIIIDRMTNETAGAGMIMHSLRRAGNITWQVQEVDREARSLIKNQKPVVLWFTGLSGAGKSTIANLLEKRLHARGQHSYLLDGDNLRHGLNYDLGFKAADRVENIRRVTEVARLMADAGLIVIVSVISPFHAERQAAKDKIGPETFVEIFVDTPLEECVRRDPKGLYIRALTGEIPNFTGIDSPYENPESPDLTITTLALTPEEAAVGIERWLVAHRYITDLSSAKSTS
ncbi:sulfate adenylate transferase subunit 1 (plasmid) [Allorhizobium ampelinum S4]|uniref:Adenylyl-sulfate kinase n=1 Tax=Allorhizobium ampelinum (strain ATCC BAA-846 / DSM 112012 / S4) TaxID=311402 RepID=B9K393_ALLAM|nr:adenylyl-sulfate kinase [Allorhizobium ampelinum]ACM39341.1 sulfate adenylate transferase subunit 1 [Allorhizobium ampelinum S4]